MCKWSKQNHSYSWHGKNAVWYYKGKLVRQTSHPIDLHLVCTLHEPTRFAGDKVFSVVTKREREDRAARAKQTAHLKDLQPIMMTTHLPSIKIFYNTVQVTPPSIFAEH